eukprot:6933427-Alexandrium_andersonii.AAC.1
MARRRDPAMWPGVLAQILWAGVAAPDDLPGLLRAHSCRAGPFQALLQDMAGLGLASPTAMRDFV